MSYNIISYYLYEHLLVDNVTLVSFVFCLPSSRLSFIRILTFSFLIYIALTLPFHVLMCHKDSFPLILSFLYLYVFLRHEGLHPFPLIVFSCLYYVYVIVAVWDCTTVIYLNVSLIVKSRFSSSF